MKKAEEGTQRGVVEELAVDGERRRGTVARIAVARAILQ